VPVTMIAPATQASNGKPATEETREEVFTD
jgi:hypothetical protein